MEKIKNKIAFKMNLPFENGGFGTAIGSLGARNADDEWQNKGGTNLFVFYYLNGAIAGGGIVKGDFDECLISYFLSCWRTKMDDSRP